MYSNKTRQVLRDPSPIRYLPCFGGAWTQYLLPLGWVRLHCSICILPEYNLTNCRQYWVVKRVSVAQLWWLLKLKPIRIITKRSKPPLIIMMMTMMMTYICLMLECLSVCHKKVISLSSCVDYTMVLIHWEVPRYVEKLNAKGAMRDIKTPPKFKAEIQPKAGFCLVMMIMIMLMITIRIIPERSHASRPNC